jgi:hypothetical protein
MGQFDCKNSKIIGRFNKLAEIGVLREMGRETSPH